MFFKKYQSEENRRKTKPEYSCASLIIHIKRKTHDVLSNKTSWYGLT